MFATLGTLGVHHRKPGEDVAPNKVLQKTADAIISLFQRKRGEVRDKEELYRVFRRSELQRKVPTNNEARYKIEKISVRHD